MTKAAIVVEGGAFRGLYASGVLDVLMEQNIEFSDVMGVSSGSINVMSYISKQIGRSARINILHSNSRDYFGLRQFLYKKNIYNLDFVFNSPINELYPFDIKTFQQSRQQLWITATDCETGKAVYIKDAKDYDRLTLAIRASCAYPLVSKMVSFDGVLCLDGNIAEPVGVQKLIDEGIEKIVLILNRHKDFRKTKNSKLKHVLNKITYGKYPELLKTLEEIPYKFNQCMDYFAELEAEQKLFIIQPRRPNDVGYLERDARKMLAMYLEGRDDMSRRMQELKSYLEI